MTNSYISLMYEGNEPTPCRGHPLDNGHVAIALPGGLDIHGPRDYLRRLFTAALDALGDGSVQWDKDGARVVALRGGNDAA